MSGIAGLYGDQLRPPRGEEATLRSMLRFIRHRGPDEAVIYLSNRLHMGTVRRNIVGVPCGRQSISDQHDRFVLCYDGGVYNYFELRKDLQRLGCRFLTESDTEVVLQAWQTWGPRCLSRFNGSFAFALYDCFADELYLARDRFGQRPLFYAQHGDQLLFASEMKSFLAVQGFGFEFDPEQLASIFTLGAPVGDQSGYRSIRQVPTGTYLTVARNGIEATRYFQVDLRSSRRIDSRVEALHAVEAVLSDAVKRQLRSEVEVGTYLSGGLDSSILSTLVAEHTNGRLRTYSFAFESEQRDDSADQRLMAAHVSSRHRTLCVTDGMLAEHLAAAAFHAEVPVCRTALVPMYLLSHMVSDDGIKIVMSGDGADEAFLGDDLFKQTLMRRSSGQLDERARLEPLHALYPHLNGQPNTSRTELLDFYQRFSTGHRPGLFSHELRIQDGLFSRRLLLDSTGSFGAIVALMREHDYLSSLSATERTQWLEYQCSLSGYLLSSQGDRMAFANSVENRTPFLDANVFELASTVNLRFDDGNVEKRLLRQAFADRLPPEISAKRQRSYDAPGAKAIVDSRPEYVDLLLSDEALRGNAVLNPAFCKLLTQKILTTPRDKLSAKHSRAFMFLLCIALQYQQFVRRRFTPVASNQSIDDILTQVIDRRFQHVSAAVH